MGILDFIKSVEDRYSFRIKIWDNIYKNKFNLKNKTVVQLYENDEFNKYIQDYVLYFNSFSNINYSKNNNYYKLQFRIKNLISIYTKINRYINKTEQGKIPFQKCLNDIVGFRFILDDDLYKEVINELVDSGYKIIDASKGEYKAKHLYIKLDNYVFQVEIQFWNKNDEKANLESHKKYKQDYIKLEKNISKGGIENVL